MVCLYIKQISYIKPAESNREHSMFRRTNLKLVTVTSETKMKSLFNRQHHTPGSNNFHPRKSLT